MASVDGLVSGLDTTTIISQLMQLERQPQVRLQSRQSAVESAITNLRALNTKFATIQTAAAKLGGDPRSTTPSDWGLATATTSDATRVTAQASTGAAAGSVSFTVEKLATGSRAMSSGATSSLSAPLLPRDSSLWISKGGAAAVEVKVGDGSLNAIVSAINASDAGVTASRVQLEAGQYTLQLSSTTTGTASTLSVATTPGGSTDPFAGTALQGLTTTAGSDAELTVFGKTVTRSSNTIPDLLEGVTLTVSKAEPGVVVDIAVARDTAGVADRVSGLVDAVNSALADIKAGTSYNVESGSKGKLYGDAAVRSLAGRLAAAVVGDGGSSAGVAGVSVTRDGTVAFDRTKFLAALAKDPSAVEKALGADGLAGRVHELAATATRSKTSADGPGLFASAITSRESQVTSLKTSISSWDDRLELRESTLKRQYAALEKALGASRSQGQWLAGQIAGLPSWS